MKNFLMLCLLLTTTVPFAFAQDSRDPHSPEYMQNSLQREILGQLKQRDDSIIRFVAAHKDLFRSEEDLKATRNVLSTLINIRTVLADKKGETALLTLQSFVGLYESLADNMAVNPEQAISGGSFVAKNEALLREVCREIQTPIVTGWGDAIVISTYTLDNVDDARAHWMASDIVEELYALNQVLVKYGATPKAATPAVSMTAQEREDMDAVLKDLNRIRKMLTNAKEEKPLLILQSFVSFYEQIAYSFAANKDIDSRFEAKNPALVKELAKELQKPISVGWEKGKNIVMGSYIAEHLPETYRAWLDYGPSDELDTFNRDILLQAN